MLTELLDKKPKEAQEILSRAPLMEEEIIELANLNKEELHQLLFVCGIELYNDLPLVACTDNELRMAYSIWRADKLKAAWKPYRKTANLTLKFFRFIKTYMERGYF